MANYKSWNIQELEDLIKRYKEEIIINKDEVMRQQLMLTLQEMEQELLSRKDQQ